jgi:hypothetical protein
MQKGLSTLAPVYMGGKKRAQRSILLQRPR